MAHRSNALGVEDVPTTSFSPPSYSLHDEPLPLYTLELQDLAEPKRAFLTQQHNVSEDIENKTADSTDQLTDLEAQGLARATATPTSVCGRAQLQEAETQRRVDLARAAKWSRAVLWAALAFEAIVFVFLAYYDSLEGAEPSISPPYSDKGTWRECEVEVDDHHKALRRQLWILCLATTVSAGIQSMLNSMKYAGFWPALQRYGAASMFPTILAVCGIILIEMQHWCPLTIVPGTV